METTRSTRLRLAASSIEINVITFSAAISVCEKCQRWQLALGLLAEMAFVKVAKDVIVYSAGISACEKGQQWQLAVRLLAELAFVKVPRTR